MEMRLVDKIRQRPASAGNQWPGKQTSFARRDPSKDVTLMDWWNLTTTDGDLPEDVQAHVYRPKRPKSLGHPRSDGPLADSLGRARRDKTPQPVVVADLPISGSAILWATPNVNRTHQFSLSISHIRSFGVMPPRFKMGRPGHVRTAKGHSGSENTLRGFHQAPAQA